MTNTNAVATPQTESKDLQLVQGSMELIQQLPDKIAKHQSSAANARKAQQALVDKIGINGDRLDETLDGETKELIIKLKKTIEVREEDRKPITQIFTTISKMFTSAEAEIKALISPLQVYRDDYAKWLHEEAERKKKEAERKAAIETAKHDLKAAITELIGLALANHLATKKQNIHVSFNGITLETYQEKSEKLKGMATAFDRGRLGKVLDYEMPAYSHLLTAEDVNVTRIAAHEEYDFDAWVAKHDQEISDLKRELVDKLPSKLTELEAAAEAERQRKEQEEKARIAEEERQKAIAAANAAEKERLEAEAKIAREAEQKKLAELKAKEEQLAAEKLQREAEEAEQLKAEKAEEERKAKENAEMAAAAAKAATLFDAAVEATPENQGVETRTGFDITVTHQAGWVEIFQLWYQNEGVKLGIEDMGKKSLNQMKAWAEKHAKSTGEKISSKYLKYETAVKAVNRK